MDMSGHLHVFAVIALRKEPLCSETGGWLGLGAYLNCLKQKKTSYPCQKPSSWSSSVSPYTDWNIVVFWIFIIFCHISWRSAAASVFPLTISSTKKEPSKQWYVITLTDNLKKNVTYQLDLSFSGNLTSDTTQGFFRASYQLHRTKEQRL